MSSYCSSGRRRKLGFFVFFLHLCHSSSSSSSGQQDKVDANVEEQLTCSSSSSKTDADGACGVGGGGHQYSREANTPKGDRWGDMLAKIQVALQSYEPRRKELDALRQGDCSLYTSVIDNDLRPWRKEGINLRMIEAARPRGTLYQIIGGRLYSESGCKFPARCAGVEHFLRLVAPELKRDVEFVVNTSDWPQVSSHFPEPLPLLSFSKTRDYADILYPAWVFWGGGPSTALHPGGLGRWDLWREKKVHWPWAMKKNVAFFRGSRTSGERDPLIHLSRKDPSLVDAAYTKNQAWKSEADTLGFPPSEEVGLEDHCAYKVLFNFRGVAASFRLKHLFLCGSLVAHVGEEWVEFFYSELKPWVHYLPVRAGAGEEELRDLLEFVSENDGVAERIATEGAAFIQKHLDLSHVTCYWKRLLEEVATLLTYRVERREDLVLR